MQQSSSLEVSGEWNFILFQYSEHTEESKQCAEIIKSRPIKFSEENCFIDFLHFSAMSKPIKCESKIALQPQQQPVSIGVVNLSIFSASSQQWSQHFKVHDLIFMMLGRGGGTLSCLQNYFHTSTCFLHTFNLVRHSGSEFSLSQSCRNSKHEFKPAEL